MKDLEVEVRRLAKRIDDVPTKSETIWTIALAFIVFVIFWAVTLAILR